MVVLVWLRELWVYVYDGVVDGGCSCSGIRVGGVGFYMVFFKGVVFGLSLCVGMWMIYKVKKVLSVVFVEN